jgi:hypothetical protein
LAIASLAAAVVTTIGPGATAIQSPVYPITLAIEAPVYPITLAIQPAINAITLGIQAIFNAIAAIIEPVFNAVAGVCKCSATDDQQCDSDCDYLPGVHNNSPLYPYKVVLSVGTTEPKKIG